MTNDNKPTRDTYVVDVEMPAAMQSLFAKLNEMGAATVALGSDHIIWTVQLDAGEDLYDMARMTLELENELNAMWPMYGETVTIGRPRKIEHVEVDGAA